jgi:Ca2+-binding EF-hand superfamily protein
MNLKKRAGSIAKLAKTFQLMDTDGSGKLDADEFEACLQKAGLFLSKQEAQSLLKHFDLDGDRKVSCNEFLFQLREELSPRRLNMVQRCFAVMDRDGSGVLNSADLKGIYCAKEHPDVIAGKKSEDQVLREFLNNFEGTTGDRDGTVTASEFTTYYEELSMGIPNDDYFVEMLSSTYMVLENPELTASDKTIIKNCLYRLKSGILQKVPPTMNLETGIDNIFKQYDKDRTGVITINELNSLCLGVGVPLERKYTMRIMKALDQDSSNTISLEELKFYVTGKKQVN